MPRTSLKVQAAIHSRSVFRIGAERGVIIMRDVRNPTSRASTI
jgi:hypothetical protein